MGLLSEHYLRGTLVVRREAEEKAGGFKIGLKNKQEEKAYLLTIVPRVTY